MGVLTKRAEYSRGSPAVAMTTPVGDARRTKPLEPFRVLAGHHRRWSTAIDAVDSVDSHRAG
jgi:hypothetical protein